MGVRSICEHGYAVSVCRCMSVHWPVAVVECANVNRHIGTPIDKWGKPLAPDGSPVVSDEASAWINAVEQSGMTRYSDDETGDTWLRLQKE